jgi:hypothetical protein
MTPEYRSSASASSAAIGSLIVESVDVRWMFVLLWSVATLGMV